MFSGLSQNLEKIFDKLRGKSFLSEADIDSSMREIRLALLEADVSIATIKHIIGQIKEKALGEEVMRSISPGQLVVKIVHDEIVALLTADNQELLLAVNPPMVMMMVGLQGSGKTTSSAKIALHLRKKHKKKVLLASLDIYRPAAQLQLESLAKQMGVDSLEITPKQSVIEIAQRALKEAKVGAYDVLILDTAGRLHTDAEMMQELKAVEQLAQPTESLLVLDALTGQDALRIGSEFSQQLKLTGVVITRMDGDARGGAALSMRHVTGLAIKFVGIGEGVNELEEFHPERAASRILGMGDVVSLVEKATEIFTQEESEKMARKLQKGAFDMDDLLNQLRGLKKMGGVASMLSMIPGAKKLKDAVGNAMQSESVLKYQEAIICSMTKAERRDPKIINASRKIRIAKGSATKVQDVNRLLKQFLEMQNMMKKVGKMDPNKMRKMFDAIN